jgi:hypothetical protein
MLLMLHTTRGTEAATMIARFVLNAQFPAGDGRRADMLPVRCIQTRSGENAIDFRLKREALVTDPHK